ncbi:MAG: GNAT family N-acetyltransferase [Vicinamibacterales bacterium]
MLRIDVYEDRDRSEWDAFVRRSKNGTFLILRDYMEYHREGFHDHSLVVRGDDGRLIALLPANRLSESLVSHGGLTYGGFITDARMKTPIMLELFSRAITFLKEHRFAVFEYKTVPHIYHSLPAEEDRYALFLAKASVKRRGLLTVVTNTNRPAIQERRMRGAKKAREQGFTIARSHDWRGYWALLTERLWASHGVRPVHALEEICALQSRFPDNIKLFACLAHSGDIVAGVVVYESRRVAHCQYVAANDRGRECQALDLLFTDLLAGEYAHKSWFDFGTSDDDNGWWLNHGLVDQKEGFGARAIVHDHYTIDLEHCDPTLISGAMA